MSLPDIELVDLPLEIRNLARVDPEVWFRFYSRIKTKEGKIIRAPKPRVVQKKMFAAYRQAKAAGVPCLMLVLKPRQDGASTAAQAITYHHNRTNDNLNGALMGDITATSDKVFDIYRNFAAWDTYPWPAGPLSEKDNQTDDVTLPNGSHYGKETAGSANAGRSGTIQVGNKTEVAFYPIEKGKDPALGFDNSHYQEGPMSLGISDTTPNGPKGWFYKAWMGKNSYIKIFVAWFEEPDHRREFATPGEREAFEAELRKDTEAMDEMIRYSLTLEQMAWRAHIIANKCGGDPEKFKQEYPSNDVECFLKSMRPCFNLVNVDQMHKLALSNPVRRGELNLFKEQMRVVFQPDDLGTVHVAEEPKVGCRYVVIADTCTGEDQQESGDKADPDYHAIGVLREGYIDVMTGKVFAPRIVCLHRSRLDADLAAEIAAAMSIWYGGCMVIPEVNGSGLLMVKRLQEMGVRVYMRQKVNVGAGTREKHAGWRTDASTRKTIIDHMKGLLREWKPGAPTVEIPFPIILEECKTFVVSESGKPEAMPGQHDDTVLMTAIALYNRGACEEMKPVRRQGVRAEDVNKREGWRLET